MGESSFMLPENASLGPPSNISMPFLMPVAPDLSNIRYPGNFTTMPLWELSLKIAFSALISVMALVGNIIVIIIVFKNKRMHTPTNYYIVNLAISDVMVTLSCTWVHLVDNITEGWVLGAFFCPFNSFAQGKKTKLSISIFSSFVQRNYVTA